MKNWPRMKRMCVTALGCFLLGSGIGLCDRAGLGTDCFTVFLVGMQSVFGLTIGQLNMAVNLLMIAVGFLIDRSMISVVTFAAMAATSIGIDSVSLLMPVRCTSLTSAIPVLLIGQLIYSFGTAVAIIPEAGFDPYNAFLIGLQKVFRCSYKVIRWGVELLFLAGGWALGGIVGAGTVLSLIVTGPLVEWIASFLRKKLNRD